ncbi:unnamed protein product, partial [Timema podura]|nr:unnamed protein product [Timema podura]
HDIASETIATSYVKEIDKLRDRTLLAKASLNGVKVTIPKWLEDFSELNIRNVIDLSLPEETNDSTTLFQRDTLKQHRIKIERSPHFCEDETMAIPDMVYIWEELSPSVRLHHARVKQGSTSMQENSTEREYQQLTLNYGERPPDNGNTWDIRAVGFNGVTKQELWNKFQGKNGVASLKMYQDMFCIPENNLQSIDKLPQKIEHSYYSGFECILPSTVQHENSSGHIPKQLIYQISNKDDEISKSELEYKALKEKEKALTPSRQSAIELYQPSSCWLLEKMVTLSADPLPHIQVLEVPGVDPEPSGSKPGALTSRPQRRESSRRPHLLNASGIVSDELKLAGYFIPILNFNLFLREGEFRGKREQKKGGEQRSRWEKGFIFLVGGAIITGGLQTLAPLLVRSEVFSVECCRDESSRAAAFNRQMSLLDMDKFLTKKIVNSFETVKMETKKLFMNSGDGDKNTKSAEEGTEKSRIYAALAFFGIMVVIGVPLWWKTTEVYRVSLPYSRIAALEKFTSAKNEILVSSQRTIFFSPQTEAPKLYDVLQQWWFRETSLQKMVDSMITPTKTDQDEIGRRRIPATKEYDILLTFINPDPDKLQVHWDLGNTIRKYLEPFLYKLSMLASYKVKSQWLYFVSLEVQPKLVTESSGIGQHYALAQDLLPHIITPLEKKLASHISHNPSLNFVVYMPTCDAAPLHIYRRQGMRVGLNAFLSPRWGGIVIHNPSASICQNDSIPEPKLVQPDSGVIMGIVLAQLKLLMGVPEIEKINKVEVLTHSNEDLYHWELDLLLRVRTLEQLTSAKITLLSLSQLLGEISNIVINDDVGKSIYHAVGNVEYATSLLKMGELKAAFQVSKQAFLSAESAFTDPSLLALLYFPDDQKYAVYIPLFLPVMIPVLMSLRNIYKFFKKNKTEEKLKFE